MTMGRGGDGARSERLTRRREPGGRGGAMFRHMPPPRVHDRITADPAVLVGKPVVRGTRLAVEFVLDLLAAGWSFDDVLANYPGLTIEDIRACIGYAKDVLAEERVFPAAGA